MEVTVTITLDDIINYLEYGNEISDDDLIELYNVIVNELKNREVLS